MSIKFQVPPSAEIPFLIANLVSRLGVKPEDNGVGSDMMLRAWDRLIAVAWFLSSLQHSSPSETKYLDHMILFYLPWLLYILLDNILNPLTSGVAWQLAFNRPKTPKGASVDQGDAKDKNVDNEEFCILMFRPLISSDKAVISHSQTTNSSSFLMLASCSVASMFFFQLLYDHTSIGTEVRVTGWLPMCRKLSS